MKKATDGGRTCRKKRLSPSDFPDDFGNGMALLIVLAVSAVFVLLV